MKKNSKQAKKKGFTQEFRDTAVQLAVTGNKSIAAVAEDLGIESWRLYGWVSTWKKRQIKEGGPEAKASLDQLAQLQKENKRLKEEVEILKKAAAYFAKTLQ
jgi:transposase